MTLITSQQVDTQTFKTRWWGRWYNADQVDQFLDQIRHTLSTYEQLQQCEHLTSKLADAILERMSRKITNMHTDDCHCHDEDGEEIA